MSINENTKKEIISIADKLEKTPHSNRDFIAGVLCGLERAEQAAAERTEETKATA